MSSNTSVEEAKADIYNKGFYKLDDAEIGSRIDAMRAGDLDFGLYSESGFDFCRGSILLNPYVQDIISALSSDVGSPYLLAYADELAPDPGHVQTLQDKGINLDYLVIQAWPRESKATFYSRSHRARDITRRQAPNFLWEAARAQLLQQGCEAEDCTFEQGGLVIFDARTFFQRLQDKSYFYVYVKSLELDRLRRQGRHGNWGVQPPASYDAHELEKLHELPGVKIEYWVKQPVAAPLIGSFRVEIERTKDVGKLKGLLASTWTDYGAFNVYQG
ncbi:hypothetical protein F66182_8733 [Fusarium sp. NRRL 66182]|nr:hypothetical protein F66182_8733 [Fusarium sp. NRRL 66182]